MIDFIISFFTVAAVAASFLAAGLAFYSFATLETLRDIAAALVILGTAYGFAVLILSL